MGCIAFSPLAQGLLTDKYLKGIPADSRVGRKLPNGALTENGLEIGKSQQTIYAKNASERVANFLSITKGFAVLALTQVSYFADGTPFEYVHSQYVGDRFEFYLENN